MAVADAVSTDVISSNRCTYTKLATPVYPRYTVENGMLAWLMPDIFQTCSGCSIALNALLHTGNALRCQSEAVDQVKPSIL
jgi:hypothetical protein